MMKVIGYFDGTIRKGMLAFDANGAAIGGLDVPAGYVPKEPVTVVDRANGTFDQLPGWVHPDNID